MRVVAIVPALDEEATVGQVVRGLLAAGVREVVVADGGSRDATRARAREAGAHLVDATGGGYGRACLAGARWALARGCDVLVFVDASGADDPACVPRALAPIAGGDADVVLGSRTLMRAHPGGLRPWQRLGNALIVTLLAHRFGTRLSDLGSIRAVRAEAWRRLGLREEGHGWPAELVGRALAVGLRVVEVPVVRRRRPAGRSKVSGHPLGALRAAAALLRVTARIVFEG